MRLTSIATFVRNYNWISGNRLDSTEFVDILLVLFTGWLCTITELAVLITTLIVPSVADLGYKLGLRLRISNFKSYESNWVDKIESSALSMFMNLLSKVAIWVSGCRVNSACKFVVASLRYHTNVTGVSHS